MGTTASSIRKDIYDAVYKSVNKATVECQGGQSISQTVDLTNIKGTMNLSNVIIQSRSKVDINCLLTTAKIDSLATDIANSVTNNLRANGLDFSLGVTSVEAHSVLRNTFKNALTNINTAKLITNIDQEQNFKLKNVEGDVYFDKFFMDSAAEVVSQNVVNSSSMTDAINKVASQVHTEATAHTTSTWENLGKFLGSVAAIPFYILGGIIVGALVLIYLTKSVLFSPIKPASTNDEKYLNLFEKLSTKTP